MTDYSLLQQNFNDALNHYDREKALNVILDALENLDIEIPILYEQVIAHSLNHIASNSVEQKIPIWAEHIKSNIVRTVIENAYPFVLRNKLSCHKSAIVLCLEEEYHELGARMSADYLTLLGFNTLFVGANTPKDEIIDVIQIFKPHVVCISVTNYFHLTRLHALIDQFQNSLADISFKLAIGGYAVHHSSNVSDLVKADYYIKNFDDLKRIKEDLV